MFNRNITVVVNYILDNIVPPVLRDRRWFMGPIIRIVYGRQTKHVLDFKEKFPFMGEDELAGYYELIKDAPINKRETDLNNACLNYILNNISGESVLDIACGRCALLKRIREKYPATEIHGADIVDLDTDIPYTQASIYELPFEDQRFDTVVCTHTLEHIRDIQKALGELLRVAKNRLIIVVPGQREYRYTPDLHVHFFPYLFTFKAEIGIEGAEYFKLKGDFVCVVNK